MSAAGDIIEAGLYYDLAIGPPVSDAWKGWPLVYQIINRTHGIIADEGVSEIQARYFLEHYDKQYATYVNEGLAGVMGEPEGPSYHG